MKNLLFGVKSEGYEVYRVDDKDGMRLLRDIFPTAEANELNFVMFSTSGIHGAYTPLNHIEKAIQAEKTQEFFDHHGNWGTFNLLTFMVVKPRVVEIVYGNCLPETLDDIEFLKKLRESSWLAMASIGKDWE